MKRVRPCMVTIIAVVGLLSIRAEAQDYSRFLDRPAAPRDEALYVTVAHARDWMKVPGTTVLVDVQPPAEWRGTHIPGSINMPMHEVKVRANFRSRTVVLVDKGWNDRRLERVCRDLRSRGFAAAILDGGVNAWLAAGEFAAGTGEGRHRVDAIKAGEYISVRADRERVAVEQAPAADTNTAVHLHVADGQPGLQRQLRDMHAMEQSTTRVVEGPSREVAQSVVPKPCSTCP